MIREYCPTIDQRLLDISSRKKCKSCGLYLNQLPLFDKQKKSNIFWVGLSAVQITEDQEKQPLSPFTRSGALIEEIEKPFIGEYSFYKTNIVKCLPLNNDKIRYPLKHEMEKCYPNLESEIETLNPSLIFLLGKQVGTFILEKLTKGDVILDDNFNYNSIVINDIMYVPIHHPSFILVYRRKQLKNYIRGIKSFFENALMPNALN